MKSLAIKDKEEFAELHIPAISQLRKLDHFKELSPKQIRYLVAWVSLGENVCAAARKAKISEKSPYNWEQIALNREHYVKAREYLKDNVDKWLVREIERTVLQDAVLGIEKVVTYQGIITGKYRERVAIPDRIKVLERKAPGKWADQSGVTAGPVSISINYGSTPADAATDITTTSSGSDD